jgi:hypothetical protein
MMGSAGFGELFVVLFLSVVWLIPVVAGIWALGTLHRVRVGQDALRAKVDEIQRLLQRE